MLLTGTYTRSLDAKLRIAVPKTLRDALSPQDEGVLFVAPGTDGSLALYPGSSFEALAERLAQASPNALAVRDYGRLFYSRASRLELDQQGRVRIPPELASLADLGKEVVLIGVQDHVELWDKQAWEAYLDQRQQQYDQIAEAAFGSPVAAETLPAAPSPVARAPK